MVSNHNFWQFLASQWNPGEFGADPAEPAAKPSSSFLAVRRVVMLWVVLVFLAADAAAAQE